MILSKSKIIKSIPNLFTLGNLVCGVISLVFIMNGFILYASGLVFLAGVCDHFDGKVARKLKVCSAIGAQLDSLADLVSFGVIPGLQMYALMPHTLFGNLLLVLFPVCGALRLARFNVNPTTDYFQGLPITAAGMLMSILVLFDMLYPFLGYIGIIFCYLMISTHRVKKL